MFVPWIKTTEYDIHLFRETMEEDTIKDTVNKDMDNREDMDNLTTEEVTVNQIMEETTTNQITITPTIKVVKNQVVIVLKLVVLVVRLLLVVVVFVICSTDDRSTKFENI